jgi:hypothetical protein
MSSSMHASQPSAGKAHLVGLGAALVVALFVGACEAAFVGAVGWGLGGVLGLPALADAVLIAALAVPALWAVIRLGRNVYRAERALAEGQIL